MKLSFTHTVWLFALWHASVVLGQDIPNSGVVDQESPTATDTVPEVTSAVPDVSITEPLEGEPGETGSAEPETSPVDVTDSSSSLETETGLVKTPDAIPSETSPTESFGTPTDASETPSATDELGDPDKITLVTDPSKLKNSTAQFVPVEITPENHLAEQAANKPSTEVSAEDAKELAVLEGSLFNDFVENAPAPPDAGQLSIPLNTSECDVNLGKRVWPFKDWKDERKCIPIRSLEFDVHYNFILPTTYGRVPPTFWQRVVANHDLLTKVYGALDVSFNMRSLRNWYPPTTGSNSNWTTVQQDEDRLLRWQRQTHQGDKMALNVWIVPGLSGFEVNGVRMGLLGYATFPKDVGKNGKADGIVMREDMMDEFVAGTRRGSTLIHETGHWLGLYHTFGQVVSEEGQDCQFGDGLLKSTHTRGHENSVFECVQMPCASEERRRIYNWMSYSDCPGGPEATRGFTTDQKAAIFARSIKYRRGIKNAECNPSDPGGRVSKRSTMQDLVDGKCPDVKAAVEELQTFDKGITDETRAKPETGGDEDDEDIAANTRTIPSLGLGVIGTTVLFLLM